jgi:hypothetical protein
MCSLSNSPYRRETRCVSSHGAGGQRATVRFRAVEMQASGYPLAPVVISVTFVGPKGLAGGDMLTKQTIAAAAAAAALSGAANAHEFACEKTVEGEVVHVVAQYPATLHFKLVITNTHPTDASTALAVRDDLLSGLGVRLAPDTPFTLQVGQSAEFEATVAVASMGECLRLSHAQSCTSSFEDALQVVFDGGVAQCAARLICMPDDRTGGREGVKP